MLGSITEKFSSILGKIGKRRLTESSIEGVIREIRLALIESDVNLKVIKSFIQRVKEKSIGTEIIQGVNASEMFIKIVQDELIYFLGEDRREIRLKEPTKMSQLMLFGLQGAGKTTTCGKLAHILKEKRDPLLVSLDIHRPSANEQLKQVAQKVGVGFFDRGKEKKLKVIIKQAQKYAQKYAHNLIIWDTAGRMHVDKELIDELKMISKLIDLDEGLLVCDAMIGQKSADIAQVFTEIAQVDGLVFTKFDSETKGGGILSVKEISGASVKYIGVGERPEDIEVFDPSRIARRILGMGDVISLVEKAQGLIDEKSAKKLEEKIKNKEFDLQDFYDQMKQMKKIGSMSSILSMIPGMSGKIDSNQIDDKKIHKLTYIIDSMTPLEKKKPFILNQSRKVRIAKGSGTSIVDVNQLLKQFNTMKQMMRKMKNPKKMKQMMNQMGLNGMNSDSFL